MRNHVLILSLVACLGFVACGGESSSSAAGTYELDRVAMAATLLEEGLRNLPEEKRGDAEIIAEAKAEAKKQAETMTLTSVLDADGTWAATGNIAGNEFSAKGTWKLDDTKLHLTTTEKDGKKVTEPETKIATLEGSVMTIAPEGAPFQFKLVRK